MASNHPAEGAAPSTLPHTLDALAAEGVAIDRSAVTILRRDAGSTIYRGWLEGTRHAILLGVGREDRPPHEFNRRAEHLFALRDWLDLDFAPVPRDLIYVSGSACLVLDDFGGELLTRMPGRPMEIALFLDVATGLFEALARMHARELVHRDLRAENILLAESGRVGIIGFGGAGRVGPEHATNEPTVASHASWPYMSPEQTGRINRPVGTRSDLYSAGVILYDLLVGALPFSADDPMGWTHQHIAIVPPPPAERNPAVPQQLSRIVMRLLAKTPETRYQTAEGVISDLRRCREEWRKSGTIPEFPVGDSDVPGRLIVAGHLYGREDDVATLLDAYERVAEDGRSRLVLLSGYSGVGKSTVASAMQAAVVRRRGIFVSGKFEQHKRDIPYATLAQALNTLVAGLIGLSDEDVAPWRSRLDAALEGNGQLMLGLVPELELIIGPQPPPPDVLPSEATRRFHGTIQRFLSVFSSPRNPLALFIDDLQWLDAATLAFIQYLAMSRDESSALLVGAYRDNEVDARHPLLTMRDQVREAGVQVIELRLEPLSVENIQTLLVDTLRETGPRVDALASLVHRKTRGNPFFTLQFIKELEVQRLLRFDRKRLRWDWDLDLIEARGYSDNVADLMLERVRRLPDRERFLIQRMACLGSVASIETLTLVTGESEADIAAWFVSVERAGLVLRRESVYKFLHDRIREAAYSLSAPADCDAVHLEIGRRLASADPEHLDANLFDTVNQIARGIELVEGDDELVAFARLFLRAARRAKADSAHDAVLAYIRAGQSLLDRMVEDAWQADYGLCFDLATSRAESELLTGRASEAERTLAGLADRAAGAIDRGTVAALRVTVYLALDDSARAIETGLAYLREDGTDWPRHPSREAATSAYERLMASIEPRAIGDLIDLPLITDPHQQVKLEVAVALLPPAFFNDENLVCLLLCRMADLSIRHGNSPASPLAYAYLGMVLPPHFGAFKPAFEFGQLGLALVERGELIRYRGRVTMCFGSHVMPWARAARLGQPFVRRAIAACRESGDITYAGFSSCTLVTNMLFCGDALVDVARDAEGGLGYVKSIGFGLIVDIMTTQLQFVRSLQGRTREFGSLDDADFSEATFETHLQSNPSLDIAACWYWIRKAQARFLSGRIDSALECIGRAEPLLWTSKGHFEHAEYHFYAGLIRAASAGATHRQARSRQLDALAIHRRQLDLLALHCRANFSARASLLAAEEARLDGDALGAMSLFEAAVMQARESRFGHDEALALELSASLHEALGLRHVAEALARQARDGYLEWGAHAKARQVEERYDLEASPTLANGSESVVSAESFDIAAVVRTAQAIASEAGLENLLRSLMRIALAHSGAERGALVRARGDALRVEARAHVEHDEIKTDLRSLPLAPEELPGTIVHTAIRTRQAVLVEDARTSEAFSADPYLKRNSCRSVLCLPLVKQSDLIGLLYLENNLASHVFTPARVAVLTLLASMAAMSMDNASLEDKESLLQEVHHRVKNNLQLISSMLSLQAMRVDDAAVAALFADSCNRLRSMALVHENLYRAGNFARVPMAAHLHNLCAQLVRAYGMEAQSIVLDVRADDLHLDLSRAVSCGLIVNELVSNALKHAFLRGQPGTVRVRLRVLHEGRCELSVDDDGLGLPALIDVANAETLGLQLVGDLTAQLHGRLSVDRSRGTRWTIAFEADLKEPT